MQGKDGKQEPVNAVKKMGDLRWRWNGKFQDLSDLSDYQLRHIIKFVDEKRGLHYNHPSEFWFNACNWLLKARQIDQRIFGYLQQTFKELKIS